MCLILFALNEHPEYRLILAANRDEFFNRETLRAHHWEENERIIGGKDVVSNGTWLGLNTNGRFIAITNYRDPSRENKNAKSRGFISRDFLLGQEDTKHFIDNISIDRKAFNGFNLLLSDDGCNSLNHYSNISKKHSNIKSGVHGLSNALLDTPWPKVTQSKKMLTELIATHSLNTADLLDLLKNSDLPPEDQLPDTGISLELEKKLSPVFISMKGYGTRCSTVLLIDHNDLVIFHEVTYNEKRENINSSKFQMKLKY